MIIGLGADIEKEVYNILNVTVNLYVWLTIGFLKRILSKYINTILFVLKLQCLQS